MNKAKELERGGPDRLERRAARAQPDANGRAVPRRRERGRAADPRRHDLEAGRMSSVLAAVRPDSWNFPLLVHVLGAMILVGGLLTGASALAFARGDARVPAPRLLDAPSRRAARLHRDAHRRPVDLLASPCRRPPRRIDPTWIGIGFIVADVGALLVLIALILGGIGVRRLRDGKGTGLLKASDGDRVGRARRRPRRRVGDVRQARLRPV